MGRTGGPALAAHLLGEPTLRAALETLNTKRQARSINKGELRTAISNIMAMLERHQTSMMQDAAKFLIATSR
eukprot:11297823-Prorocentrum_lima.AAC.1